MASYKDYINMSPSELMKKDKKELAKIVTIMDSAANKRLKRLRKAGFDDTQAIQAHRGMFSNLDKFSVKGASIGQLRKQFISVRSFLGSKTSTVAGSRKVEKELKKRLGIKGELTKEKKSKLWRAYNRFTEQYGGDPSTKQKMYDSTQIQQSIINMIDNGESDEDILNNLDEYMREQYEQQTEEEQQTEFNFIGQDNPFEQPADPVRRTKRTNSNKKRKKS